MNFGHPPPLVFSAEHRKFLEIGESRMVESRLQKLETEGKVAQTIIRSYEHSGCLIHVVLAFGEHYRIETALRWGDQ